MSAAALRHDREPLDLLADEFWAEAPERSHGAAPARIGSLTVVPPVTEPGSAPQPLIPVASPTPLVAPPTPASVGRAMPGPAVPSPTAMARPRPIAPKAPTAPRPLPPVQVMPVSPFSVHLTTFTSHDLRGSWNDHHRAYQMVSELMRAKGQKRLNPHETRHILYRLDPLTGPDGQHTGHYTVTIQSSVPPRRVPGTGTTRVIDETEWWLSATERVSIRLALNPSRVRSSARLSITEGSNFDDLALRRRRLNTTAVPHEKVEDWLKSVLAQGLSDIAVVSHKRRRSKGNPHINQRLTVDWLELTARVSDPVVFDAMRRAGVGQAKPHGCGLLLVSRELP